MTTKTLSVFLLSALAVVLFPAPAGAETVSYTAAMDTSVGNPVTNIMTWETDGANTYIDYVFELPGVGMSVLSHDMPFTPTQSLVVGQTVGVDADGNDKAQIVMFLDDDFAAANAGQKFSVAFPNTRHSILLSNLQAAVGGDATQLAWFGNTFFPGDGAAAAFDTGGSFTVAEFTRLNVIGGTATHGNWTVDRVVNTSAWHVPVKGEFDLPRSAIEETATDTGPFDVRFEIKYYDSLVTGTGAIDKTLLNDSGEDWTSFEMILGTGLGGAFAASTPGDKLAFDEPFSSSLPSELTDFFADLLIEEDRLVFSNGVLPAGERADFTVYVTVSELSDNPFTIRQTGIPEPATMSLLGLGGLALLRRRRGYGGQALRRRRHVG